MKYLSTTLHITCNSELPTDSKLSAPALLACKARTLSSQLQACKDLLADSLGEVGYESFMDTDDGIVGYVQEQDYAEDNVKTVIEDFPIEGVSITYDTESIPDQDWNATWEAEGFAPINIDNRIIIYDANHIDEEFSTPIQIGIQARNAFGTGTHETTRMIISTLLDTKLEGRRVLDCGCGTGILGIAALKCGASEVVAYDIDEFSSENAKHNAVLNGVGDHMDVLLGDANVLSHVDGVFDVVLANINRNILLNDMPRFCEVMASGATLILSGFYTEDAPMLLQKAETLGLHEISRKTDQNWCCLVLS